jgi:outer membrane immunogenic protein
MRLIGSTSFALIILGTAANAADMGRPIPYSAPPMIAPPSWTGFYLGVNLGGGFGKDRVGFGFVGAPGLASINNAFDGFLGGGQLGYNYQIGSFVVGGETDIQATSLKSSLTTPALAGLSASYSQKVPWFGTARVRLGYAQPAWMIYATGGFAYAAVDTSATATAGAAVASFSSDKSRTGWTAGSGIEVKLTPNWSLTGEYLYVDLGSVQETWTFVGIPSVVNDSHITMNVVRAGVNYRF